MVLEEILKTEDTYYHDLLIIVQLQKEAPVSIEDSERLFCNVQELSDLHAAVLAAFKIESRKPAEDQNWGAIFKLYLKEFRSLYQQYTQNQKQLRVVRARLMKDETFKAWATKRQLELRNDLNAFLIKPVQRICKYPLLMRELTKAYEKMEVVVTDEAKRDLETAMEAMADVLNDAEDHMKTIRAARSK